MVSFRFNQAGDINNVCNHGRSSRQCTGARTIIQGFSNHIGIDTDSIHHAINVGQQTAFRNQSRVYTQLDAFVGFTGNTQQFDAIAKLFSVFDIATIEFADAFQIAGRKVHRCTECQCAHDGDFMAGIMTFDIKSGVSFCIAQSLSFFQYVCKRAAFFTHFSKNKVAGTINNTGDTANLVCSQSFTQSLDDRDTAGNSSFKLHHDIFFFCQRENFIAVFS